MTPKLCLFFLGFTVATLTRQENDEWIDPYNMLSYDSTSKTMRENPEESNKKCGMESAPVRNQDQEDVNENSAPEISNCSRKLSILQRQIEDIKRTAAELMKQSDFTCPPNSKLAELLKGIHKLNTPHKDDFCNTPYEWLYTLLEDSRRYISVWLLTAGTHFTELSEFTSLPDVKYWLIPTTCVLSVIFLHLIVRGVVRRQRGQPDPRHRPREEEPDGLQNGDRQPEDQEGDADIAEFHCRSQSLDRSVNMQGDDLDPEREIDAAEDECCDENYSITKLPTTETQPATLQFWPGVGESFVKSPQQAYLSKVEHHELLVGSVVLEGEGREREDREIGNRNSNKDHLKAKRLSVNSKSLQQKQEEPSPTTQRQNQGQPALKGPGEGEHNCLQNDDRQQENQTEDGDILELQGQDQSLDLFVSMQVDSLGPERANERNLSGSPSSGT
ncbi:hypothetical protein MATL_G00025100 [Megalops atlanticus]|uniref:Chloride channel CLIC-like protein 1 n=1 Tax=Megalops atlanticus TaxID=7932 RepID=A0A9D3QBQ7_MEGAT|nr:hypothetical protein MATL_G00025100 [Megalops atlanticus]